MKKKNKLGLIFIISIVFIMLIAFAKLMGPISKTEASPGVPNSEASRRIQETIVLSYVIENEAAMTFDTSRFATVFVDDDRGDLSLDQLKFVQNVTQQINKTDFGYLTYKLAYYNWWSKGAIAMEELQAKAVEENRDITKEEIQKLIESQSGLLPPARAEFLIEEPNIKFISLTINEDLSTVTFDDGPRTNEATLVKINGSWFIAGNSILALHP